MKENNDNDIENNLLSNLKENQENKENKIPHRKSKLHERLRQYDNYQNTYSNILNPNSEDENNKFDNEDDNEYSPVNFDLGKNIYRYNIILVGDCSVGKTSIINRFIENRFNRNLKSTINIEFRIKSIKLSPRCSAKYLTDRDRKSVV